MGSFKFLHLIHVFTRVVLATRVRPMNPPPKNPSTTIKSRYRDSFSSLHTHIYTFHQWAYQFIEFDIGSYEKLPIGNQRRQSWLWTHYRHNHWGFVWLGWYGMAQHLSTSCTCTCTEWAQDNHASLKSCMRIYVWILSYGDRIWVLRIYFQIWVLIKDLYLNLSYKGPQLEVSKNLFLNLSLKDRPKLTPTYFS